MDSRLYPLNWPEGEQQQEKALEAQSELELGADVPETRPEFLAFQAWLQRQAPIKVVIPYIRAFHSLLRKSRADERLLRDAARHRSIIKGIAILRSGKREPDAKGRIVATLDDYETMAALVEDDYPAAASGVSEKVRKLVEAVPETGSINQLELAKKFGVVQGTVSKWMKRALKDGYINDIGYGSQRYQRGVPLPSKAELPTRQQIEEWKPQRTPVPPAPPEKTE